MELLFFLGNEIPLPLLALNLFCLFHNLKRYKKYTFSDLSLSMIKLWFHSVFSTRFSCVPITHHFNILRILYFHFSLILQIFFTILIIRGYKWICCAKIFLFQRKPSMYHILIFCQV